MRSFRLALLGATWHERLLACLAATLAIAIAGFVSAMVLDEPSPLLLGPVAASAVLVFAVPASPLAQPWRVIGGNVISAFVGIATATLIPDSTMAAEAALGLSMLVMTLTRSFHPPGGAMALSAALSGPSVEKWGLLYPLLPVGINTLVLVAAGMAFHALFGRSYPHRTADEPIVLPADAHRIRTQDVDRAIEQAGGTFDISREDLDRLIDLAEANAATRCEAERAALRAARKVKPKKP